MATKTYLWLDDILPDVVVDFDNYVRCEREVLTPALQAAGFITFDRWYTGDGDSFGPLTRCIDTNRGTIVYG